MKLLVTAIQMDHLMKLILLLQTLVVPMKRSSKTVELHVLQTMIIALILRSIRQLGSAFACMIQLLIQSTRVSLTHQK